MRPPSGQERPLREIVIHQMHANMSRPDLAEFGNLSPSQMGSNTDEMMALLDGTMFSGYDSSAMSIDIDDALPQQYSTISPHPNQAALLSPDAGDQNYGVDGTASNVPGAGPLPTASFGSQVTLGGTSTLTEFTKRRNWPAKVVEELRDFLQILDANGRIKHVSPSVESLTGYEAEDVQDLFLKDLIHQDDVGVFTSELNESIATGNPLRMFYRFKKKDGDFIMFESVGHAHIAATKFAPNPNNQSPFCQAVFMMSRPHPTKNACLLDSFLEHKIENERLKRRIAELRRQEQEENDESQNTRRQSQEGQSDMTPSEDATQTSVASFQPINNSAHTMPPPERTASLNIALTRENLEGIAGSQPDSIREKMARYEGATHAETIEMLTGLRYLEGERSKGITTGNASPTLIKGDAGIAIPLDKDPRSWEKKKKVKAAEEYVCTDCGTLDSPEWRKGPSGPKTLCNACGLRWAKKEKKRAAANNGKNVGGLCVGLPIVDGLG